MSIITQSQQSVQIYTDLVLDDIKKLLTLWSILIF